MFLFADGRLQRVYEDPSHGNFGVCNLTALDRCQRTRTAPPGKMRRRFPELDGIGIECPPGVVVVDLDPAHQFGIPPVGAEGDSVDDPRRHRGDRHDPDAEFGACARCREKQLFGAAGTRFFELGIQQAHEGLRIGGFQFDPADDLPGGGRLDFVEACRRDPGRRRLRRPFTRQRPLKHCAVVDDLGAG